MACILIKYNIWNFDEKQSSGFNFVKLKLIIHSFIDFY